MAEEGKSPHIHEEISISYPEVEPQVAVDTGIVIGQVVSPPSRGVAPNFGQGPIPPSAPRNNNNMYG